MRTGTQYMKDLLSYNKGLFIKNTILMIFDGILSGAGIAMLVPMLSLIGLSGGQTPDMLPNKITQFMTQSGKAISLLVILTAYFALVTLEALLAARISVKNSMLVQGYTRHLRNSLSRLILKAEWPCLSGKKSSDLINSFSSDIARIAAGTVFVLNILFQCFLAIFQLVLAFCMSAPLTFLVLLCAVIFIGVTRSVFHKSQVFGRNLCQNNMEFMGQAAEQLKAIREIKVYGRVNEEQRRFETVTDKTREIQISLTALQASSGKRNKIVAALVISVLFFISFVFLHISPALLIVLVYIFARLWPLVASLQNNVQNVLVMMPSFLSLKMLMNDLEKHAERADQFGCLYPKFSIRDGICFKNVSFNYGEPSSFELKKLNFTIKARAITAFVGRSGAGKTTIFDLILGLLIPCEGQILVDGMAVDEGSLLSWRRGIGYVPQEPFLFNGTVRDNLTRYFPSATREDIQQALMLADAWEFIEKLPLGVDTPIADNGVRLSGGQRQRIVLARALISKPELLVLDEATSALDSESEQRILKTMKLLSRQMTIVVIAHRHSTISQADRIVVVEDGQIADEGDFDQLFGREGSCNNM